MSHSHSGPWRLPLAVAAVLVLGLSGCGSAAPERAGNGPAPTPGCTMHRIIDRPGGEVLVRCIDGDDADAGDAASTLRVHDCIRHHIVEQAGGSVRVTCLDSVHG